VIDALAVIISVAVLFLSFGSTASTTLSGSSAAASSAFDRLGARFSAPQLDQSSSAISALQQGHNSLVAAVQSFERWVVRSSQQRR
jgi:hypothetical protein